MTKIPLPLIILTGSVIGGPLGVGASPFCFRRESRESSMRVTIYKAEDKTFALLVEPALGKGIVPVMVMGLDAEKVAGTAAPIIDEMRVAVRGGRE